MELEWECPVCRSWFAVFETVSDLAAHVQAWHDEWLTGNQLPPPLV